MTGAELLGWFRIDHPAHRWTHGNAEMPVALGTLRVPAVILEIWVFLCRAESGGRGDMRYGNRGVTERLPNMSRSDERRSVPTIVSEIIGSSTFTRFIETIPQYLTQVLSHEQKVIK